MLRKIVWNIAAILVLVALAFGAAQLIRQALKPWLLLQYQYGGSHGRR
jgi:hypothetical protein